MYNIELAQQKYLKMEIFYSVLDKLILELNTRFAAGPRGASNDLVDDGWMTEFNFTFTLVPNIHRN